MHLLRPDPQPANLLDVFLQRYSNLLRFAESLTRDRREAEDLVQDACVRLLLAPPDISHVDNVDAYLIASLRNLHTTRTRRRLIRPEAHASIVDFDSAGFALEALSPPSSLHARDALRASARFACTRRFASKTASLFILHFFHEYVRAEVGIIAHLSRASVDTGLTRGRVEVRAYLDDPDAALRAIGLSTIPELRVDGRSGGDDDDYVARLRGAIFALRHPRCFERPLLRRLYSDTTLPIATEVLAEIVTCPRCLDAVSRITRLPTLAERHPHSAYGATPGPRREATGPNHQREAFRLAAEQRARIVRAHRPRGLRVLVNGFQIGSHDVTTPATRATHALSAREPARLVEICSEQRVCLATLPLDPVPDGGVAQRTAIDLDDGQRLDVRVVFDAQWPTLELTYVQPDDLWTVEDWSGNEQHATSTLHEPDARASGALEHRPSVERPVEAADLGRRASAWIRWPFPLWFVFAGILLGLLLANPSQTLAAVDHLRRLIVGSIVTMLDRISRPKVLPSRPFTRAIDATPPVVPSPARSEVTARVPSARGGPSDIELAEMMLETFRRLYDVGALTREQVGVDRRADRRLHVEGVVKSETRRRELLEALGDLPARHLRVTLVTVEEATRAQPVTSPMIDSLRSAELSRNSEPPGYEHVRRYLATHPKSQEQAGSEDAVGRLSGVLLARSLQAREHARTLQTLVTSVSRDEASRLAPRAQQTWRDLVRHQAAGLRDETMSLRRRLEQVFPVGSNDGDTPPVAEDGDVWQIADRLFELASVHDDRVRRAFTVAIDGEDSLQVDTSAFRWSLVEAERLGEMLLTRFPSPTTP